MVSFNSPIFSFNSVILLTLVVLVFCRVLFVFFNSPISLVNWAIVLTLAVLVSFNWAILLTLAVLVSFNSPIFSFNWAIVLTLAVLVSFNWAILLSLAVLVFCRVFFNSSISFFKSFIACIIVCPSVGFNSLVISVNDSDRRLISLSNDSIYFITSLSLFILFLMFCNSFSALSRDCWVDFNFLIFSFNLTIFSFNSTILLFCASVEPDNIFSSFSICFFSFSICFFSFFKKVIFCFNIDKTLLSTHFSFFWKSAQFVIIPKITTPVTIIPVAIKIIIIVLFILIIKNNIYF